MVDNRSFKVLFLAHCLMNQNTIVPWLVKYKYSSFVPELVDLAKKYNLGIEVLPCPEFELLGLKRNPMSKDEYEKRGLRSLCAKLAEEVKKHHQKLIDAGIMVFGIIGIAGSPSCGVNKTNRSKNGGYVEVKGKGIFIEELQKRMETIYLEWDYRNPEDSLRKVEKEILKKIRESSLIIDSH